LLLSIDEGCERPAADGYLSDGPHGAAATMRERKKGKSISYPLKHVNLILATGN
jgi:hypothetical protein